MTQRQIHKTLSYLIEVVWIGNGLFCKVLNLAPRHEQIVARILGDANARALTILIGLFEIGIAVWILTGIKTRLNAFLQITIVVTMNILEFFLVPDLLLWGRLNSFFALLFVLVVYLNEFQLNKKLTLGT